MVKGWKPTFVSAWLLVFLKVSTKRRTSFSRQSGRDDGQAIVLASDRVALDLFMLVVALREGRWRAIGLAGRVAYPGRAFDQQFRTVVAQ